MLSPKSIPDVTPPAVTILPSLTMRAFSWVAPTSGSNSVNAQCVVARRPLSNPAAPRIKAPVHTEVTYFAEVDCLRINSIVSRSPIANDPGTAAWYADQIQARAILIGMRRYKAEAAIARHWRF